MGSVCRLALWVVEPPAGIVPATRCRAYDAAEILKEGAGMPPPVTSLSGACRLDVERDSWRVGRRRRARGRGSYRHWYSLSGAASPWATRAFLVPLPAPASTRTRTARRDRACGRQRGLNRKVWAALDRPAVWYQFTCVLLCVKREPVILGQGVKPVGFVRHLAPGASSLAPAGCLARASGLWFAPAVWPRRVICGSRVVFSRGA